MTRRPQKISGGTAFRESVDIVDSSIAGIGCRITSPVVSEECIGWERPVASFISVYSERTIPACHVCFRHALPFRELVNVLITERSRDNFAANHSSRKCAHCSFRCCFTCWTTSNIRSHFLVCHRDDDHRRGLVNRLRSLADRYSDSILMATTFAARVSIKAVHNNQSAADVFGTCYNSEGYFDCHPCPPYPQNGYDLVKELLDPFPIIPEDLFNRIIATFDHTNLFVEIESFSMMQDLQDPIEGLDDLQKVHSGPTGFSAIQPDHSDGGFPIPVVVGSAHYPTIARLNHSCDPNVDWRAVDGTNEIEVYALRDISHGEELFISYIDQSLPKPARQTQLWSLYGFTCECRKCQLE